MQRLDVVDQRRAAEHADLRYVGRPMPGQPALALDQLDHGALFAADVGAGPAPHVDLGVLGEAGGFELGDLGFEDLQHRRVLVAHINKNVDGLHRPGRDQHALQELVRLALEVDAVLEGAGLALVAVDRHQPRTLLGPHQAPLAPRRKARAAQAPQAAVGQRRDHLVHLARARQARAQHRISASFHVSVESLVGGNVPRAPRRVRQSRETLARVAWST